MRRTHFDGIIASVLGHKPLETAVPWAELKITDDLCDEIHLNPPTVYSVEWQYS
jgi:hypothetical protein